MLSVNDILTFVFMYVVEIEESMCVADVDRGESTILICNSSFLATAGKLQKVGTAVLGNNIKTVKTLISGLWLIQSVSEKWTISTVS